MITSSFLLLGCLFFVFHVNAKVVGFYHVWSPNDPLLPSDVQILKDQIRTMTNTFSFHLTSDLHISLIGNSSSLSTLINHIYATTNTTIYTTNLKRLPKITFSQIPSGFEPVTIKKLWDHCITNPKDIVWYLHNKGAYHSTEGNHILRSILSQYALSSQCYNEVVAESDACGMRFTDIPHRHFPGNMWIAKCSYIRLLPDPTIGRGVPCSFGGQIVLGFYSTPCFVDPCLATGRFYIEHWLGYLVDGVMSGCLGKDLSQMKAENNSFTKDSIRCKKFQPSDLATAIGPVICARLNLKVDRKLYGTKEQHQTKSIYE
jgi:hypothetical protein